MKRYSFFLFLFLILLVPLESSASAQTFTFNDTSGHDYYAICSNASDFRPFGVVYGFDGKFWEPPKSNKYINNVNYNVFVTHSTDAFEYVDFHIKAKSPFELPITFFYPDGQANLTLSVNFVETGYWFWFTERMNVTLKDGENVLISSEYTNLFNQYVRLYFNSDGIRISNTDLGTFSSSLTDTSVNISMFPLTAISFDLTSVDSSSYCIVKVIDWQIQDGQLDGWLMWFYSKISFIDSNMVIYNVLVYITYMWRFFSFIITFFVFSTWSYLILSNVFGLMWGIMQRDKGSLAMFQGYIEGLYYCLLLPVRLFVFCVNLILRIVRIII